MKQSVGGRDDLEYFLRTFAYITMTSAAGSPSFVMVCSRSAIFAPVFPALIAAAKAWGNIRRVYDHSRDFFTMVSSAFVLVSDSSLSCDS